MRLDAALARMPVRRECAIALASAIGAIEGVRVLPSPPQVSMFHLHFDADAGSLDGARLELAQRESVWIGGRFAPSAAPRSASLEVNVGDALCAEAPSRVAAAFRSLVDIAHHPA
jgi:hypothetical protein